VSTLFDYPLYFALRDVLLNGAPTGRITDYCGTTAVRNPTSWYIFVSHVARFASAKGSSVAKLKMACLDAYAARGFRNLYGDEMACREATSRQRRDFLALARRHERIHFETGRTREHRKIL